MLLRHPGAWRAYWRCSRSGLFDPHFYCAKYPDVAAARISPVLHYVLHGAGEGRKPHPLFDPVYYLRSCPEACDAPIPLIHFLQARGRWGNPHPLFCCRAYLRAHPEAAAQGINPLVHYVLTANAAPVEGSPFDQRCAS